MLIPPFCPCHTKAFGTVTRFRCRTCGKNFGEQTYRLTTLPNARDE